MNPCKGWLDCVATDTKLFKILFSSLGWQEIKIPTLEKKVLCSALKWRVAIVAKRRAPMMKPVKV